MLAATACTKGSGPDTTPPGPSSSTDGVATATADTTGTPDPTGTPDDAGSNADGDPDSGATAAGESLLIDGVTLSLVPDGCQLTATYLDQRQTHTFDFPGACQFSPDAQGQPWVVPTDNGKAVIVESWAPADRGCDTALQVVVITDKGPQLSRDIQRVSQCGPGPWDEMMYHVLSSDRVALGGAG